MEILFQKIKQIKDRELPFDISKKVQRRILLDKLKIPLTFCVFSLSSLVLLSVRIYNLLVESGAISVLKVIVGDFEMSWDYITESWEGLVETMPVAEIRLIIINLVVVCLVGWYMRRVWKTQKANLLKI